MAQAAPPAAAARHAPAAAAGSPRQSMRCHAAVEPLRRPVRRHTGQHQQGQLRTLTAAAAAKAAERAGTRRQQQFVQVEPDGSDAWRLDPVIEALKQGAVGIIPTGGWQAGRAGRQPAGRAAAVQRRPRHTARHTHLAPTAGPPACPPSPQTMLQTATRPSCATWAAGARWRSCWRSSAPAPPPAAPSCAATCRWLGAGGWLGGRPRRPMRLQHARHGCAGTAQQVHRQHAAPGRSPQPLA